MEPANRTPRALLVAAALLALSGLTSLVGNMIIARGFTDRPRPEDLLLRLVPAFKVAEYVTEVAIISSFLVLLVYVLRHAREDFTGMIALFGIFYLMRSVLMVLTPLANSWTGQGHFGFIPLDQLGMFPSGHVGASLLCVMLIDPERAPVLKRVALALLLTQIAGLILARGHYSIDIAGGLLLAYFVHREWTCGTLFAPIRRLMGPGARSVSDSSVA